MTYTDHFSVVDDAIEPQPWMQLRLVKSDTVDSVSKIYDPNDALAKNDLLQSLTMTWTNNSPVNQYVYGMVTRSGSQVTLQCRSRGYLSTSHGITVGAAGAAVAVTEVSRFGVGTDLGNGGLLGAGVFQEFGISELRQNSTTVPLRPDLTGWFLVAPGQSFNAAITVNFISEFWENTIILGGDADTESKVITGDIRLDLFALPAVVAPGPRVVPTIVGGTANVLSGISSTATTTITTPTGLTTNDLLIAIVANQYGLPAFTEPVQTGWTLLHTRTESTLLGLLNGSNLRVYARKITGSAASSYSFTNNVGTEQIGVMLGLRNAVPPDAAEGLNWYVASSMTSYNLFNQLKTQSAPSVSRSGQMLLCMSYLGHTTLQAPLTQTVPTGMTKIGDYTGTGSAMTLAYLDNPPNPTTERVFTPSKAISFGGYALSASIVVPGARQ